jgi:hypothetical protein
MPPGGQQPPYGPVPVQQPPKKAKRFGWPTVLLVAFGSWLIGFVMALLGGTDTAPTTAEPIAPVTVTETETVTETAEAKPAPTASKAPTTKNTTEPKSESTMEEGSYEIGVDAKPGRYKTRVPEDSFGCYWERTKDDSGDFDSIIANDNVNPGARASVTVKRGEFFKSNGCGTWTMV